MASPLPSLYEAAKPGKATLHSTFNVDYVIDYRFATTDQAEAEAAFAKLVDALARVGLETEVRNGDNCAVLVFVRISCPRHLDAEIYRARVQDWLYGVRTAAPEKDIQKAIAEEPITEAERLRLVYLLITKPNSEGGAGITPKRGEWANVESVFALHDHQFNKKWITEWSTRYVLDIKDLTVVRDRFGEKIAFYFAFLQSYFMFLIFPAAFGFASWVLLGHYSPIYAIVNCLWCVGFVEYWRKQEVDLAFQWNVTGIGKIQLKRPEFRHEREFTDPVTGEKMRTYSPFKRLARQALQIPFSIIASVVLGSLICTCFSIEIFISEIYAGPFKSYLVFLPTVILSTVMPALSSILTRFASRLTDIENYETTDAYESAMIQKIFVLNFITSYLPIILTAFVYVPFASVLVPYLDIFQLTVKPFAENAKQMTAPKSGFEINPDRLKKQVIYFTVTAQIVNLALEVIVPYVKRRVFRKVKEVQANSTKKSERKQDHTVSDLPEEHDFLTRVRNEAELGVYDVATDFREMIMQFGYLSLFSVVWPLTAVSFLINNWIELRSDALKITIETQRPIPWRADSIGPWIDSLGFLAWFGSLTTAALVYLFSGDGMGTDGSPRQLAGWALLLTMFFAEHIFLAVKLAVRYGLSKIDSPGQQKLRRERFSIKRKYLEEALGKADAERFVGDSFTAGEKIDRRSLEDEARRSTLTGQGTPEDRFWARQRGPAETIGVGKRLIAQQGAALKVDKKNQ
ncbi:hypothetical protein VC83_06251 [Pseudogymnoascus destructans]|uniref:Plasma membrane channel protein n=2 Tax=Pseudogymnoascus destructans TaxID=655981 RepID=L8GCD7_PSED2|nr:uncharacterized protein VC83_06251 [Pseudogymnoascus destructans]ELR09701.1 hypothetical protein GMDG_04187 [Pseudogymnoascus destructans 20631-21]OAF58916.1 hypothetical protein VC83_06251 [Pseudogymnoascus destructans]